MYKTQILYANKIVILMFLRLLIVRHLSFIKYYEATNV